MSSDQRNKIISIYNQFNGKNLDLLDGFYAADVEFHDPVTSLKGLINLKDYYRHAYAHVKSIQFSFSEIIKDEEKYCSCWQMNIVIPTLNSGKQYTVTGNSRLNFNNDGLVNYHRDYLDLGEMVYEKIPIQGFLLRSLKKKLAP